MLCDRPACEVWLIPPGSDRAGATQQERCYGLLIENIDPADYSRDDGKTIVVLSRTGPVALHGLPSRDFLGRCLSVDLEVDQKTVKVFTLAAVSRGETPAIVSQKGGLDECLDRLEGALTTTDQLICHNILRHDLPHLVAAQSRLAALAQGAIDTLWLNPLAFPCTPITIWSSIITLAGCRPGKSTTRSWMRGWFSMCWRTSSMPFANCRIRRRMR